MRSALLHGAVVVIVFGGGASIGFAASADPVRAGGAALCTDRDMSVYAWQATQATEIYQTLPGTVSINATDGQSDPKTAEFQWHNLTTGASGEADGDGSGAAGASALNVVTGAGRVEITTDFTRSGLFFSTENTAHCAGTLTVV